MSRIIKFFQRLTLKSVLFNFKYLPFKKAIKLPFFVSNNVILLKSSGNIAISGPIKTGMIQIGYSFGGVGLFDEKGSRSIWELEGKITFKGTARIGSGSAIHVGKNGIIDFGDNFVVTANTKIISKKYIKFGKDCLISWDCLFMDSDFHKIFDENDNLINPNKSILVGDKVWIGCRTSVLKGSEIANNSVIGSNSVVAKNISKKSGLYVGNPIRLSRENIKWGY